MFFAIVIARHLYGGLGHNIFNPAMIGYAVCLVAFPKEMVVWPAWALDGMTEATPLDHASSILSHNLIPYYLLNAAWLAGGLFLLFKKIIRWQIPVGVIIGLMITACLFPHPVLQLGLGSTMIAAFFIATDPVTAPGEPKMRLIYGLFVGSLIILLRQYSSYPDGVAFAILLGNLCVPLMDSLSVRKST
jgi:electron transport complex protein RnfD